MTAFPKYPKYKDSGVEWLGDVPEHWEVRKGRYIFSESNERSKDGTETHLSMSQRFGLVPADQLTAKSLQSESYEGAKLCRTGDIVLNRLKAHLGVFSVAKQPGVISPDYSVFRLLSSAHQPQFFDFLFKTPAYMTAFNKAVRGIVVGFFRLYSGDFYNIQFLVPPPDEQDRIVAFLDEKTAEIDRLIAKKQRQIELLDEQKAILINRAVTRGLHPQADLQDSGIPWIGPIPKGWRVAPLYGRCEVRLGKMLDGSRITGRRLQPYLRNTDVQWFKINTDSLPMMDFSISEYERYSVRRGDLLVCEGGEPGRAAIWESDDLCFFQKALHRVRPIKGDHPRFLLYLFRNAVTQSAFSGFEKATIAHLTGEQLRRFRFAFPPPAEQKQIASHLDKVGDAFETARTKLESQIQTLQTLRSTLIAHAVTGKIRVSSPE